MAERWPVIDTHFHIGVNSGVTFIAEEELIPWMDEAGTDIQIVFQVNEGFTHRTPEWNPFVGNDYVAKIQKMYPDRVIGLGMIDPYQQAPTEYLWPSPKQGQTFKLVTRNETLEELDRCILDLGLHGLKMHPFEHGFPIDSPALMHPIMRRLVELQKQVNRQMILVIHAGGDSIFNSPEAIANVASVFPDLLFIMAHAGFIWGGWMLADTVGPLPNVMLDFTTNPQKNIVWEAYQRYGADRLTVGTDGPFVGHHVRTWIVYDFTEDAEERRLILGGNLAKRLGIPKTSAPNGLKPERLLQSRDAPVLR